MRRSFLGTLTVMLILAAAACAQDTDVTGTDDTPEPTPSPATLSVSGDFRLVGEVQSTDEGDSPEEPLPDTLPDVTPEPGQDDHRTPDEQGSMTVEVQSFSEALAGECAISEDDTVTVYWTIDTRFAPPPQTVESDDFPSILEGTQVTVLGTILRDDEDAALTPSPDETPDDATPEADLEEDCILVAQAVNVAVGTGDGAPATPRPGTTPGATPTPTAEATPTAGATPTPAN